MCCTRRRIQCTPARNKDDKKTTIISSDNEAKLLPFLASFASREAKDIGDVCAQATLMAHAPS